MDGNSVASDQVIAELIGMGFEFDAVSEAIKAVGPSVDDALEYILNGSHRSENGASSSSSFISNGSRALPKRASSSSHSSSQMRQSSIVEHMKSVNRPRRSKTSSGVSVSGLEVLPRNVGNPYDHLRIINSNTRAASEAPVVPPFYKDEEGIGPDWEQKVQNVLQKHFGYSSLKSFQKEALAAWLAHKDCLVLAATGSGKSLCFQIPALLTGKVVIVISPLISLMHDQCLKLAKHGVSACFLGSGQIDKSVEQKALGGMYDIIYVCPETILRLMKPLQSLAESHGIALFAIDEVHCISKWGHGFRPDYRRLSVLRENFTAERLKFLKFDIPLMALTATATTRVREDILKSLCMSQETRIVLTSFFRPNLRFSVKHSKTSSFSSYKGDFQELIEIYTKSSKSGRKQHLFSPDLQDASESSAMASNGCNSEQEEMYDSEINNNDDTSSGSDDEADLVMTNGSATSEGRKLSVEYLEDECDLQEVDDLDVSCGEFFGQFPRKDFNICVPETHDFPLKPEERLKLQQGPIIEGPTIIYAPTRKETISISKFLCKFGVKAAAYNAKLPKSHLRQVHKEFHENALQVVVATIAFGMGIDKSNVRRIIHYGWPQSLEAYYQEAGRAGRDGKLADCVLYANLFKTPTLLPSQRSEEQTKQAYKMLSDCFRYGMSTSRCRAKTLVEYFDEEFHQEKCFLCDVCVSGPPEMQNLRAEVTLFMQVTAGAHFRQSNYEGSPYDYDDGLRVSSSGKRRKSVDKTNIKTLVSRIREQNAEFSASDLTWWRGLARILEDKGFIREGDDMNHVQVKFPELTELGHRFLRSEEEQPFYVYREADMLLATKNPKPFSSFSEWGKGWADPEIRRQRLAGKQSWRKSKMRKFHKLRPNSNTVRGRLATKLLKQKR